MHGEMTEMSRLKSALEREYESCTDNPVKVFNPKNLETVTFHFRGEKMAKVRVAGLINVLLLGGQCSVILALLLLLLLAGRAECVEVVWTHGENEGGLGDEENDGI